jgi:hypothetical protein
MRRGIQPGRPSREAFWEAMSELEEKRHPRRPGRLGAALAAALAALLVAVLLLSLHLGRPLWALPAGSTTPAPTSVPTAPRAGPPVPTPVSTPPPTPAGGAATPTPTALPRCHTSDLALSVGQRQGAMGTVYVTFVLEDDSGHACEMYGFPGMLLLDAAGKPLPTTVHWQDGRLAQPGPSLVVLQPGQTAHFDVAFSNVPRGSETCEETGAVLVTPPDETTQLRVAGAFRACDAGNVDASPVRAGTG